jgi:division protein 1
VCLTGGEDGNVRLWDLRRVDEEDEWGGEGEIVSLSDVAEEDESRGEDGDIVERPNGIRSSSESGTERDDPCARLLEGHSKAVTALYFEDECLVSFPPCYVVIVQRPTCIRKFHRSLVLLTKPFGNGTSPRASAS